MKESLAITQAKEIIHSVKNQPQTVEQRCSLAIDLAALMVDEARRVRSKDEIKHQAQLQGMICQPKSRDFFNTIVDRCFRCRSTFRAADQIVYTIKKYGIPPYLPFLQRLELIAFRYLGKLFAPVLIPLMNHAIRKETKGIIIDGNPKSITRHIQKRLHDGVRINLNHLGEAVLGEEEAQRRLQIYLDDLAKPEITYISVKISTIYSQINLLSWQDTVTILCERLRLLYLASIKHASIHPDGTRVPKFVNLDMEEYKDLHLTVAAFRQTMDEPEFFQYSAGIVLQAYLPDSFLFQQELTIWAMQRIAHGGAPIKIRIVKGANLAMEQLEASLRHWPQAPYLTKSEVDANFKKMVHYGIDGQHAKAAHIGIGSHNLFDIAYALLLRSENGLENEVTFEMLEGMADHIRRVVQNFSGNMILYCPVASKKEFNNAIAYLFRRLDENTAPDNFLSHLFDIQTGSEEWDKQVKLFAESCVHEQGTSSVPQRTQNRLKPDFHESSMACFENEPDTDWSLPQNRKWAERLIKTWREKGIGSIPSEIRSRYHQRRHFRTRIIYRRAAENAEKAQSGFHKTCLFIVPSALSLRSLRLCGKTLPRPLAYSKSQIPLVIDGKEFLSNVNKGIGTDPSHPNKTLYHYTLADDDQVDATLKAAKAQQAAWASTSISERSSLLAAVAKGLREHRDDLIGAMIADTGKTVPEADIEISEAIDFAEYYSRSAEEWHTLPDVSWHPKGTVLVTPPWNFPCSIPAGCILAALAMGNCVIFKPANEAVLVGWTLAQIFWDAGVSRQVLQFICCPDEPIGSRLIQDPRIDVVMLTGATSTAKKMLQLRPGLDLIAETGGKNALIVTRMADRDLAIKDLVQSAFGHAGQKCSACSLGILEAEVYDDPHFRQQLRDAAASWKVGSPWDLKTRIPPLIQSPSAVLWRALTTLEPGEEWLLKPEQYPDNPHLWSPGIKLGVAAGSFTHQTELFGPVLGLMRARNLTHAIELANGTQYGLTAGLHTLDEREQDLWMTQIRAGNCYINRGITGAIVQRQPFGGCKNSSFGKGMKAGGPNYVLQLAHAEQIALPTEREQDIAAVASLNAHAKNLLSQQWDIWRASVESYAFYWKTYFSKDHDPSGVLGQDNLLRYVPHAKVVFRIQDNDSAMDVLRVIAAALTTGTPLDVSCSDSRYNWIKQVPGTQWIQETEAQLIDRIAAHPIERIRLLATPSSPLQIALATAGSRIHSDPVMANGRIELLHYLREVSISHDTHRYGNIYRCDSKK